MIKAVIFDMDGVIIDSEPDHIKQEMKLFKSLGLDMNEEEHQRFIGTTSYYMWETIKKENNLAFSVEELVNMDREKYYNHLCSMEDINPIEGVYELIENLHEKKIKLAIASSSPIKVIELVVKRLKADKFFSALVQGDDVLESKPEPDIFLYAAQRLNVDPKECAVIEDSKNGVNGAKKAGMRAIGYLNPNSGNQDLSNADLIIKSFKNIEVGKILGE